MAMAKVRSECNKVAGMSVFQVPVSKSMKLEEFEQAQAQVSTQVILSLQHTTHETKISKVQFCLESSCAVGKVTCVKTGDCNKIFLRSSSIFIK